MPKKSHTLPKLEPIQMTPNGYTLDIDYFLGSAYDDIGQASEEIPAILEYVNEQLQTVRENRRIKEQELKRVQATVYFDLKRDSKFSDLYPGKPTEDAIKHAINLDKRVDAITDELAVYDGWTMRLSNLINNISAKLDLVRSTEATRRKIFPDDNIED